MQDLTNGRLDEAKAFAKKNDDKTLEQRLSAIESRCSADKLDGYVLTGFKPMQFSVLLKSGKTTIETVSLEYDGRVEDMGSGRWPSPDEPAGKWVITKR